MKLKIFFQILFLTVSFNNFGQISNDSIISKKYNHPKKESSIDFFFRFPVGSFGQNFKPDGSSAMSGILESIEGTNGGMGAEMGYEIEFSRYCFFNKKTSNTNFGLKITYLSFSSIPFNWATSGDYIYNNADFSNLDFLSFKAGPVLRIAISEKKSFQFYDQLCLTYGWNGGWNLDTAYYVNNYRVSDQSEFKLQTGWGVRNEIGK